MNRPILVLIAALTRFVMPQDGTSGSIFVVPGRVCPPDSRVLTRDEATTAFRDTCRVLGTWYIARLAEGGSMDGPGYGCGIRAGDARDLGHILCKREAPPTPVSEIAGDPRA